MVNSLKVSLNQKVKAEGRKALEKFPVFSNLFSSRVLQPGDIKSRTSKQAVAIEIKTRETAREGKHSLVGSEHKRWNQEEGRSLCWASLSH